MIRFSDIGRGLFGSVKAPRASAPHAPVIDHPIFGGVRSLFHLPTHTPRNRIAPVQVQRVKLGSNNAG